jgi:acetyltransferase-like isoleucine patch superfamily enzyme
MRHCKLIKNITRARAFYQSEGNFTNMLDNQILTNVNTGTTILKDVSLGKNVRFFNFVNLYGCKIGDDTKIGAFVEIQKNAEIGKRCKISSHSFICEGVQIGNDVFIGHGVMFINDKNPKASVNGVPITDQWTLSETFIEDEVSIGSNATILCGIRIHKGAVIGAGAVVTKDVPENTIVAGNPAKPIHTSSFESE